MVFNHFLERVKTLEPYFQHQTPFTHTKSDTRKPDTYHCHRLIYCVGRVPQVLLLFYKMSSDSDSDCDQWSHIQKSNVKPGMFVSGWEDPDDEVEEDPDPQGNLSTIR